MRLWVSESGNEAVGSSEPGNEADHPLHTLCPPYMSLADLCCIQLPNSTSYTVASFAAISATPTSKQCCNSDVYVHIQLWLGPRCPLGDYTNSLVRALFCTTSVHCSLVLVLAMYCVGKLLPAGRQDFT